MMEVETPSEIKNVLIRIKSTTRMLQEVKSDTLKIERDAFLKPLFENTPLDRGSDPTDPDNPRESDDVVLRKNIFHVAKKISNPNELILALMHRGLLTSEEIESILPLKDNLFKSVATFACVITREAEKFPVLLDALRQSNNSSIADSLGNSARKFEAGGPNIPDSSEHWTCQNCTFINRNALSNVCEMCFKSQDYMTAATNCTLVCQHCTYFNPPGHSHCDMCNNRIGVEEVEEDEGCGDQSADQFFSVPYPSDCEEFVDD